MRSTTLFIFLKWLRTAHSYTAPPLYLLHHIAGTTLSGREFFVPQDRQYLMKGCRPGDVVLAPFRLGTSTYTRPLVILSVAEDGNLQVCPFTSKHPANRPALACAIHDFQEGGLDLFEDSYILVDERRTITERSIQHKKGTLEPDYFRTLFQSAHTVL